MDTGYRSLSPRFRKQAKIILILTFLVFASYANSLNNAFVSDDIYSIPGNPAIGKAGYFWAPPFIYPRQLFIFIIHKLFGLNPLFYRFPNILFHLGSTWVIFFLLGLSFTPPIPFFAACIFAVHPILIESVTWISGGPYAQYSFFLLLAFLFYILSKEKKKFYFLSLVCLLLSLLTTERAVVFPFMLLAWEAGLGSFSRNWKKLIPFFGLGGAWLVMQLLTIGQRAAILETQFYQEPGIDNPLIQIPIAITSYLQLIFWPKALTLYHSELSFTQTGYLIRLAIFILFSGIIIYSYKRRHQVFFWLSFFIISLLPTLTPFRISWIVAERYVYLGALGIFVVVATGFKKLSEVKKLKLFSYFIFSLIIIALSIRTVIRNIDWKNQDNLWMATGRTSPSSPNTHNNLGDVYARRGDLENAAREFKKAIEIKPSYADAYHNLANTYLEMRKTEEAIGTYQKAIFFNPNLWQSYQNLAAVYFRQERYGPAGENLIQALKIKPQNSTLHINLGIVYLRQGQNLKAKDEFRKAYELEPDNRQAKELYFSTP